MSDEVKSKKPTRTIVVDAESEEQAKEWMDLPEDLPVPPPPIAQDFTDNPLQSGPPIDVPDIPIKNIPHAIPTSEEEESTLRRTLHRLGLKAKPVVEEISGEKLKFVEDGSKLAAHVLSAVLGLMFALAGAEYELLAPTEDMAYNILKPLARMYARHSTVVSQISPDYIDASEAVAAIAKYAAFVTRTMREIKEMKARGYVYTKAPRGTEEQATQDEQQASVEPDGGYSPGERYEYAGAGRTGRGYIITNPGYEAATPGQNGSGMPGSGSNDFSGPTSYPGADNANVPGTGAAITFSPQYTSDEQRRQHAALLSLTRRDIQHRTRRAGFLR